VRSFWSARFDSGQTTAIAQVAEQNGIPLVINIAAAPEITDQGYKFVFRNFPTAKMILGDAFANQKEVLQTWWARRQRQSSSCMSTTLSARDVEGHNFVMRSSTCLTRL